MLCKAVVYYILSLLALGTCDGREVRGSAPENSVLVVNNTPLKLDSCRDSF